MITFNICDISLTIKSNTLKFTEEDKVRFLAHIPVGGGTGIKPIEIEHIYSLYYEITERGNKLIIKAPWSVKIPFEFIELSYLFLKKHLIKLNFYLVHSICFEMKGKKVLVLGESESGKTTLVNQLLKHKYKVYSADKTVISLKDDNIVDKAGTKILSVRKKDDYLWNELFKNKTIRPTRILYSDNVINELTSDYIDCIVKIERSEYNTISFTTIDYDDFFDLRRDNLITDSIDYQLNTRVKQIQLNKQVLSIKGDIEFIYESIIKNVN